MEFLEVVDESAYRIIEVGCGAVVIWRDLREDIVDNGKRLVVIRMRKGEVCKLFRVQAVRVLIHRHYQRFVLVDS